MSRSRDRSRSWSHWWVLSRELRATARPTLNVAVVPAATPTRRKNSRKSTLNNNTVAINQRNGEKSWRRQGPRHGDRATRRQSGDEKLRLLAALKQLQSRPHNVCLGILIKWFSIWPNCFQRPFSLNPSSLGADAAFQFKMKKHLSKREREGTFIEPYTNIIRV